MPQEDVYAIDPEALKIGDQTLMQLAFGITKQQHKGQGPENLERIVWTIRYAYICGLQQGFAKANEDLEALLKRLPQEPKPPSPEAGMKASVGFTGRAR